MAEPEILKPAVHAIGIMELVGLGITKIVEEKLTSPIIGNGTLSSSVIKGIAGGLAHSYLPKGYLNTIISGAFLVDAGEDAAVSLLGYTGVGAASQEQGVNW